MKAKLFRLSALMLLVMLSVQGCSTSGSVKSIELSQSPASCLTECRAVPEAGSSLSDWEYSILEQYAECAILRKQCIAALAKRTMK